jgi:DNA-directed RNA polymerase specialized sigma24 family protein
MPLPPTRASEWEDFDLAQMCDLLDEDEAVRLKAMAQIASAYKGPLFGFVRNKFSTFSAEDAEDIVQQTIIEFWNKVEGAKFDASGSLKSLLFTISLRKGIDEWRRRTSKKRTDDEVVDAVAGAISGTDVDAALNSGGSTRKPFET